MILAGQFGLLEQFSAELVEWLKSSGVLVLGENTSQLNHSEFCLCIDRCLAGIDAENEWDFAPDLLVSIGGAVVSKRIKTFLRKHKPKEHYRIGIFPFVEDTFGILTASWNQHPDVLLNYEHLLKAKNTNYKSQWLNLAEKVRSRHSKFLLSSAFSDLSAFASILDGLPEKCDLHLGNSSVVRYAQLFEPNPSVRYFSNRGVSGIDGSTSTALGFANGFPDRLSVLISGDISFFYDSNAFWNNYLPPNFRIIVIDNGGGGIFRYLPGPSSTPQLPYFVAPHSGDVQKYCVAFRIECKEATSVDELTQLLPAFLKSDGRRSKVLIVKTSQINNEDILSDYFRAMSE